MLNKIVLMGRLTADVEVTTTDGGKRVANFTLAVERDYLNSDGERDTDFISCTAWEGKADFLRKWFGKGDIVIVSGSLYVSQYEKDSEKRSHSYVSVSDIYFTDARKTDEQREMDKDMIIAMIEDVEDIPF